MRKIKAYLILFFTGWKSVEFFGNPKEILGDYIVCLKNNMVTEYNYSKLTNRWFSHLFGDESKQNPIIFWRKHPKPPKK